MPDEKTAYRKVACPSCGAPLQFKTGETSTRCQFCHAVIERPEPPAPAVPPAFAASPHPSSEAPVYIPTPWVVPQPARRFPYGCLAGSIAMALVGVVVWLAFLPGAPDTFLRPPVQVREANLLPAADPSSPPDAAAVVYDIFAEQYFLARLDPARHGVVWRSPALEDYSSLRGLASANGVVYLTDDTRLLAFDAADGRALWEAELADMLGYCEGCLSATGNRVLALTQDYTLQAFDAATGETAWSRRLAGYTSGYAVSGNSLLVIDKEEEYALFRLSAVDGSVEWNVTPVCRGEDDFFTEHLDSVARVILETESAPSPEPASVYLIYGWNPGCLERRDFSDGGLRWQHSEEQGFSPSGDYSTLLTEEALFFAADNLLWRTDTESGDNHQVAALQDYEPVPVALTGDRLIVRVKRTRGSEKFGLWGVDPASGEKYWEVALEKSTPLEPPDDISGLVDEDQTAFAVRLTDGRLALVEFGAQPMQAKIITLDPKTGGVMGESTFPLDALGDFYSPPDIVAWQDPILWVTLESRLLGVDVRTGKAVLGYP